MKARALLIMVALFFAGLPLARADRVHLVDGGVLEGKVETQGDKVVVELDSGTLSLPRESVKRVEKAALPERATGKSTPTQDADARKAALEEQRLPAEAEAAEHARSSAQLEVEAQRVALEQAKLELARAQARNEDRGETTTEPAAVPAYPVYYGYFHPFTRNRFWHENAHENAHEYARRAHARTHARKQRAHGTFPIPGVRDPRDTTWPIPGVRDPLAR